MALELRNPHSVLAALKTRPQDVLEVRLHSNSADGAWENVVAIASQLRVPVRRGVARAPDGRRRPKAQASDTERTGAAEASVKERNSVPLDSLFAGATSAGGETGVPVGPSATRGLWLALDCLQDPHNVGAIFRTAAFYGVQGSVVTKDRSAPLNATVYDISSGGIEYVPFAVQPNLSRSLEEAKQAGLWILGASEHAATDIADIPRDRPWLLVLGNEEKGLRRLTLEKCDEVCRLTPRGHVTSLNVSVAAGILMAALA